MTPEERAEIRARHYQYRPAHTDEYDICPTCSQWPIDVPWPCDAARLLDALDDAERQIDALNDDVDAEIVRTEQGIEYVSQRLDALLAALRDPSDEVVSAVRAYAWGNGEAEARAAIAVLAKAVLDD